MEDKIVTVKAAFIASFAIINSFLVSRFGALLPLLYIVMITMVGDLITRMYAAGSKRNPDEKIESKKVWQGVYRKLGLCLLITFCLVLDAGVLQIAAIIGINIVTKIIFTALILAWIFTREVVSIIENFQLAGIEVPSFVMKVIEAIKKKLEDIGNSLIRDGENK